MSSGTPFHCDRAKAARIAPLTTEKIAPDVAFCVNARAHAVHAITGWACQTPEHRCADF
ncbi:MAG: hypothetical protein GY892_21835 [Shimia sp.]|nr:hypothetical protein [Shimia sp.]